MTVNNAEDSEEYVCSNQDTSSSDSESLVDEQSDAFLDELSEEDISCLTDTVYEEFDIYMKEKILQLSSPNFYKTLITHVSKNIMDYLVDFDIEEDDYDEIEEFVEQLSEVYFDALDMPMRQTTHSSIEQKGRMFVDKDEIDGILEYLKNLPQPKQKTPEWYLFRYNLMTASNLWKALGSEAMQNSLIYEKCRPFDFSQSYYGQSNTESALHWGNKYEPVTVMVYEDMFQTKVGDFGCIQHPVYSFIGASPDGINIDFTNERYGRMLEIKNIVNREITGIPKEEYWIQTQIQMETCGLEECDFMETRFLEYADKDAYEADDSREYKGIILYFIERTINTNLQTITTTSNAPIYRYMPVGLDEEEQEEWLNNEKVEAKDKGWVLFKTLYWYLEEFSCVLIQRNRKWFEAAVPKIEEIWNTILKERVDGYQHRATKKRSNSIQVVGMDASNSYLVKNVPLTNSICLVRLDH